VRPCFAALLAALLAACGSSPAPLPKPQRIVLLSLDTVRADLLAQPRQHGLVNVARLLEEGAHFTRAWAAASYTLPAHATLLTGTDAAEHPLHTARPALAPGTPTMAERLRAAGYATRGFHEGGYLRESYGFARGFDRYTQLPRRTLVRQRLPEVLDWIERHAAERFFLFLHTYAAHDPYGGWKTLRERHPELALPSAPVVRELAATYSEGDDPALIPTAHRHLFQLFNPLAERGVSRVRAVALRPVEALKEHPHFEFGVAAMRASYDARVVTTDRMLGKLRERLETLDLWEDTLLVVTADHGEAFFEHGQPWHGYVPYEEVLRVPWIISYPRLFERSGARSIEAPVWHLDFLPTLLALAGLPPDPSLPGRDLSAALRGHETLPEDHALFPLVLEVDTLLPEPPRRVAIRAPLKFVPQHPRFHASGDQLFDLTADPGETHNLLDTQPAAAAELARLASDYEAGLRPPPPAPAGAALDPAESAALRELGYVE